MKYKSEIYEAIHQDAMANFEVGAISETEMREFDDMCLVYDSGTDHSSEKAETLEYATA